MARVLLCHQADECKPVLDVALCEQPDRTVQQALLTRITLLVSGRAEVVQAVVKDVLASISKPASEKPAGADT